MISFAKRAVLLVGIAFTVVASPARAEKLTKAEIIQKGKAATAFVDIPKYKFAYTAFCVHPSGLFVVGEQAVLARSKSEIHLVLDVGLKTERIVPATVVRTDAGLNLALLRIATKGVLPSLALGTADGIAEQMDVFAFGFRTGASAGDGRREYPSVSVNAGKVTAMRKKGAELESMQVNLGINYDRAGPPLLDDTGKVIGVVARKATDGISEVIPVNRLRQFLDGFTFEFAPPELTRSNIDKQLEFKAKVVSILPAAKAPSVRLVLRASDQEPRDYPMTAKDGWYIVAAPPAAKSGLVAITVHLTTGTVSGKVDDLDFKIGDKPVKFSGVKRIELKPKPLVELADGKIVEGEVSGLKPVEVVVGDEKLKLDLRKATQIQIAPIAEITLVTATVIATVDGKEIGRAEVPMPIKSAVAKVASADPKIDSSKSPPSPITPPGPADDRVVKRLPTPFDEVVLGGGGRYLVFRMPKLHKLGLFDINEARVTNYIPLEEDNMPFAAGLDCVITGLPKKGVLERWSLNTFERDLSVAPSFKEEIKTVFMGHSSTSAVVVNGTILDPATLKALPLAFPTTGIDRLYKPMNRLFPSGDGTVYGAWNNHFSPGSATTFVIEGGQFKRHDEGTMGHVIPGPDGKTVFTASGFASTTLKRANPEDDKFGYCLPAATGNYFMSLTPAAPDGNGSLTIYLLGQPRALARLERFDHGLRFNGWDREDFGAWRRIHFFPQANVIAVLPASNDQVVLHKFDVDAALEKSGLDYLVVTSTPPRRAKAGDTLDYKIAAKAKHSPVSFKLDLGPKGMEVSKDGQLTWKVPTDAIDSEQAVILTVRDAKGQEIFHTFAIRVVK